MSLSGTISAVYVRSRDLRRVCEHYGPDRVPADLACSVERYIGAEFMAVRVGSEWGEEPFDLAEDSQEFGEAVGLRLKTRGGEDAVVFEHWKDGKWVRRLAFTPERGWDRVQGEPEAWEADAFSEPITEGARRPVLKGDALFLTLLSHFRLPGVWPD